MKKNILLLLFFLMTTQFSFAGSIDYSKLSPSIQEELGYLWFHEMLYQADILKKMNSIDDWDDYQECLDNFVSHFESATIKEEAKVVVGFMVYGNCVEFWEKIVTNEYEKTVQKIEKEKREAKNMSVEELKAHMYRKGDEAKENLMLTERLKKETEFYWNKYNMYKEKAKKQGLSNLLNIRD